MWRRRSITASAGRARAMTVVFAVEPDDSSRPAPARGQSRSAPVAFARRPGGLALVAPRRCAPAAGARGGARRLDTHGRKRRQVHVAVVVLIHDGGATAQHLLGEPPVAPVAVGGEELVEHLLGGIRQHAAVTVSYTHLTL